MTYHYCFFLCLSTSIDLKNHETGIVIYFRGKIQEMTKQENEYGDMLIFSKNNYMFLWKIPFKVISVLLLYLHYVTYIVKI